jgi:hypothetical protein
MSTVHATDRRLAAIKTDIRKFAAELVKDDDKLDLRDVRAMLDRARQNGGGEVGKKDAADLKFVREHYKDKFTLGALKELDSAMGNFVKEQINRLKERDRQGKIDRQVAKLDEQAELRRRDRKLEDMGVDPVKRFKLTRQFGVGRS